MLTKRIIPCLDVKEGRVVKGVKFVNLQDAGDPAALGSFYDKEGADELVFLDITASHEKRDTMLSVVEKVAQKVFIPYTVGGGIYSLENIREILKRGADKVSINTAAVKRPRLVKEASEKFGSQCIVVAIDAKRVNTEPTDRDGQDTDKCGGKSRSRGFSPVGKWQVYTHGGRTPTGLDAVGWAKKVEKLGAGEILLTSMDRDGTQIGYDIELTKAISSAVSIPVIASGGAGTLEHIYSAVTKAGADAALLASLLHYGTLRIKQIKEYLKRKGVAVRL